MAAIAVLARTNAALRPMEDALAVAGVRYRLLGKSGYWQQREVKDCLAFVACAVFLSDFAVGTALRAPFWPSKFIKKTEVAAKLKGKPEDQLAIQFLHTMKDEAVGKFVHFLDSLRRYRDLPAKEAVGKILNELRVNEHFSEFEGDPDNSPLENLTELVRIAGRFSSLKEFLEYARKVSAASKSKKAVMLSTIHAFKGMEADVVFVVACNEGILPHAKATDLREEKNIFFVAASRPRSVLNIGYWGAPSRFLLPFITPKEEMSK